MRNFNTKVDGDPTSAGEVVAAEYNSLFGELKNVASIVGGLDEADSLQLLKAIDLMSKANLYNDVGGVNTVVLTRLGSIGNVESANDGMSFEFIAANTNTGAVSLKLNGLPARPALSNGNDLVAGYLGAGRRYSVVYDATNSIFEIKDSGSSVPSGAVIPFFGQTIHSGFLKANGAAVSRTAYAALFAEIGTAFGVGDGASTFNLPDSRGEFLRGWDNGRGIDAGRVFGSLQLDGFKSHTHGVSSKTLNNVSGGALNVGSTYVSPWGQTSAVGINETRPRNLAVQFLIKY